ncbi:hypothetical protein HYH03_012654 [Edaphochlamys debaryana]|uniref:BZIP domain-containing protein n=1 Tax=Edaphochlamys debaryana TaxID=47281 RepID=A0A835XTR6_9CHLO|nr:hypothetical protein HYH03_012654 [Edaphochlamys debaryana]|eukprot:KAG2488858.1 hypothetical protein HYH03_012654 [Edaphochlamys debaryana]
MEDVLKLLAAGADVTPFTFPAGLLGASGASTLGLGGSLGASNLDLALALQTGNLPSFLMGSLGSGGGGPLPLPQALALPSLELPKLLSLDMGLADQGGRGNMGGMMDGTGNSSDPSGSAGGALPPRNGSGRALRNPLPELPQPVRLGAVKRESGTPPPSGPRAKRQALMDDGDGMGPSDLDQDRAPEGRPEQREKRRPVPKRRGGDDASDSDGGLGSDTNSDSGEHGRAPARGRGGGRGGTKLDPVAKAAARQLKKRDLNREAQRRFRDRQKAALALLESTTQSQQREIEALRLTNKLLEEQYRVLMDQYKQLQLRFVASQMKNQSSK